MGRLYHALPGPLALRILLIVIGVLIALVLLGLLFEWGGNFLDSGGTMGIVSFLH
ncbi:hypothetical protein BMS3Abin02_00047 [bacterium BMS3Abin02]|nr:hypothetical protein BMS3Abin02_00047 [bacterium BMS3Abin02]GBE23157.1 hypothetical protein BMS3Bbin01_02541 [bacterium BMS3Bbin01]